MEFTPYDKRMLSLAKTIASQSPDPYMKVGAVAPRLDGAGVVFGYNDIPTKPENNSIWLDREFRRPYVVHAEVMYILGHSQPRLID